MVAGDDQQAGWRLERGDARRVLWDLLAEVDLPVAVTGGVPGGRFVKLPFPVYRPDSVAEATDDAFIQIREYDGDAKLLVARLATWRPDIPRPSLRDVREVDQSTFDSLLSGSVVAAIHALFELDELDGVRADAADRLDELNRRAASWKQDAEAEIDRQRLELAARIAIADEQLERSRAEVATESAVLQTNLRELEASGLKRLLDVQHGPDTPPVRTPLGLAIPPDSIGRLVSALAVSALQYPAAIVRRALIAHCLSSALGQLVLYAGPPGSGKSSLALELPRLLDMECNVVAVRPGWLDSSDLLGFFDPRDGRFVPAPFLDLVINAHRAEDAGSLHVVVLDEMNIARIENFGADLLSQLERAHERGGRGTLRLYSPTIQRELDRKVVDAVRGGADVRLAPIPAELAVPASLVIAGTLNHDESTEHLSPKVLDRSVVVRVPWHAPQPNAAPGEQAPAVLTLGRDVIDAIVSAAPSHADIARELWSMATHLFRDLEIPRVQLSHRLARCFELAPSIAATFEIDPSDVLDDLVVTKILPWVSFFPSRDPQAKRDLEACALNAATEGFAGVASEIRSLLDQGDDLIDYLR